MTSMDTTNSLFDKRENEHRNPTNCSSCITEKDNEYTVERTVEDEEERCDFGARTNFGNDVLEGQSKTWRHSAINHARK